MGACGSKEDATHKDDAIVLADQLAPRHPGIDFDFLFKFLIVGDSGVGKSALLLRFSENTFSPQFVSTTGVDFKFRTMKIDGSVVKMQIWDTAGQERFRSVTNSFFRAAHGIILVYDVTNPESFEHIQTWLNQADLHAPEEAVKLLVGNKCDLENDRQVSHNQGADYAKSQNMVFLETSAKKAQNADAIFLTLARAVKAKMTAK